MMVLRRLREAALFFYRRNFVFYLFLGVAFWGSYGNASGTALPLAVVLRISLLRPPPPRSRIVPDTYQYVFYPPRRVTLCCVVSHVWYDTSRSAGLT